MSEQAHSLGMVGYGEVGRIFCAGLMAQVASVSAWDLKFATDPTGEAGSHVCFRPCRHYHDGKATR